MDYRSIIESQYNREAWQSLLHDIFKAGASFRATPIPIDAHSHLAAQSLQLGTITLADDNRIAVYEIKLSDSVDIVENRVGIRNLLISDWKMKGCVGAFMFCYRDNESVLRFSYVSSAFKFTDEGKMEKDETDTKRYTYLLGEGHRCRTAIKQFEELKNSKLMLADLTKAFSIEALSDRFFKDYKELYEDIIEHVTGKRMMKVANKWEEKVVHAPEESIMNEFSCFDDAEKAVRDYVKRLLGRIVFLQFIQKKGWLGVPVGKDWGEGDKEFIQNIYEKSSSKDNFIDGVLELLFNDINSKRDNDLANPALGHGIRVPYLNGGLFEQDKADECTFRLPKKLMDKMFTFFSAYNFTIDENDPDDAEIGVDPEMLGRIFENLLEDNKDKGAFYTPKEIVQFMCKESLIAYLQTGKEDFEKDAIRRFVTTYKSELLSDELKYDVDEKLKSVKICDPAIGSGAFPMGLLKELFACRSAIEGLDSDTAAEIKKHIIQNNIYGVDIEKGAVDIARLRFWLALIVDEKTPHALPNMDFKIMQGNSLMPTFNGKYVNFSDKQHHVNSSKIRDAKKELFTLQSKFYDAEGDTKKELLVRIKYLILEIVKLQMDFEYKLEAQNSAQDYSLFDEKPTKVKTIDEEKNRIVGICSRLQMALHSTTKSLSDKVELAIPFFDWKTMFSDVFQDSTNDEPGFDICIGNPPYIQLQSNDGLLGKMYADIGFKSFASTGDIYCLFYEKGWQLLNRNGKLCYITSNKWMRAGYGSKLRNFFANYTTPMQLIDFAGVKIFDNATVDTNILLLSRERVDSVQTQAAVIPSKDVLNNLSDYVQHNQTPGRFTDGSSWVILSPIELSIKKKVEAIGTPLSEWDVNIYRGVLTGYNDAFIIPTEKRDEILANCQSESERERTAEIIRPILRGRDIHRYACQWDNLWIISTFPSKHYDINDYPAIKDYLLTIGMEKLEQTGAEHIVNGRKVKSRKKTSNKWFETQDSISYWDDLSKPKIIWGEISDKSKFFLDSNGDYYPEATTFLLTGEGLPKLLAFLNCKLSEYLFSKIGTTTGVGTVRWKKFKIEQLPIPAVIDQDKDNAIVCLVEQILKLPNDAQNKIELEKEIDRLVYQVYGLNEDEVLFIENR